MNCKKLTLNDSGYPRLLAQISDPPKELYYIGTSPQDLLDGKTAIAIVGSRKVSQYGRLVTNKLGSRLASHGIVVVSGLALGVDGLAQKAAVEAGGKVIAVLACGLDRVYPSSHTHIARQILNTGGTLISEYPPGTDPLKHHFIARNRIISGISQAVILTEAAENSGSLHTAQFALEQGREVLAVPGNITSPTSMGTNNLIKVGATPITNINDIFNALNIKEELLVQPQPASSSEAVILQLMSRGILDIDLLLANSGLGQKLFNQTLTMLEISGKIHATGNGTWSLS